MFKNIPGSFTEAILCSISEPALIYDRDIRVIWANPAAELFFGRSTEYMTGKKCTDLFSGPLECFDNCPVRKSIETGIDQVVVVDGIENSSKMIETISHNSAHEELVLAIIHTVPDIDRDKALRRDFAAKLNQWATLKDAAPDIITAINSLTSASVCGIYTRADGKFILFHGKGVPQTISGDSHGFSSPLYLPSNNLPFSSEYVFPDGVAIVPVVSPDGNTDVLLFAGQGTLGTKQRHRLEMIASVLESCIGRLTYRF
ncbi:MAG: PAS domain-containing protein [Candidatus Sabulitectum sp.]|nr:PAS domain-containing protein [Candidatus Sabulitectum sp.]